MPLVERVAKSLEPVQKIWMHSVLASSNRDVVLRSYVGMLDGLKKGIERGDFTLEDPIAPQPIAAEG